MPNIQIKDVPATTHAVLRRRAGASGQSLQEYLRTKLIAEAAQPTLDEVLNGVAERPEGVLSFADSAESVRADRARR